MLQLEINDDNFLECGNKIIKFYDLQKLSRLQEPVNKTEWINHGDVTDTNAYFRLMENSVGKKIHSDVATNNTSKIFLIYRVGKIKELYFFNVCVL